ncbi:MAG: 30S ribosomal protein S7 [Bacteriovoracaceae bacterium]|nr:30S ribosomal protein S7 [Bacteriovoracaceae bacterium]
MSRKHKAEIRDVLPDPRFNDITITKFINGIMESGKKSIAEKIFYGALDQIESKMSEEGIKVFKKAMSNVKPSVEVKSRRIGGATYQVPIEVRPNRRQSLAIKWIRDNAKDRSGKSMLDKLAEELIDAANNRGGAIKKKEDVYKMAEANKAFAHLKW